jgi:outer membrane protein assembly factor BamA
VGGCIRRILEEAGGTFVPSLPNTLVLFANQPGATGPQPDYVHADIGITSDTRNYKGHPTSGAVYRASLLSYWDRGPGNFSFREYDAEAMQIIGCARSGGCWRCAAGSSSPDVPGGNEIRSILQPSIGGQNTLRAFGSFRFHDDNTLVANVESRWALFQHVDVAAFLDAGNVAPSFGDLNVDKYSVGGGVRLHTLRSTAGPRRRGVRQRGLAVPLPHDRSAATRTPDAADRGRPVRP